MDTPKPQSYRVPGTSSGGLLSSSRSGSEIEPSFLVRERELPGRATSTQRSFSETMAETLHRSSEPASKPARVDRSVVPVRKSTSTEAPSSLRADSPPTTSLEPANRGETTASTNATANGAGNGAAKVRTQRSVQQQQAPSTVAETATTATTVSPNSEATLSATENENASGETKPTAGVDVDQIKSAPAGEASPLNSDLVLFLASLHLQTPPVVADLSPKPVGSNSAGAADPLLALTDPATPDIASAEETTEPPTEAAPVSASSTFSDAETNGATPARASAVSALYRQVLQSNGSELPTDEAIEGMEASSADSALDRAQPMPDAKASAAPASKLPSSTPAESGASFVQPSEAREVAPVVQPKASIEAAPTEVADDGGDDAEASINRSGTSAAHTQRVMKTDPMPFAPNRPAAAVGSPNEEPKAGMISSVTQASAGGKESSTRDDRGSDSKQSPSVAEVMAAAGARSENVTRSDATEALETVSPVDISGVESLREQILLRAIEFREQNPSSMTVVLRPDSGTELSVQLRSGAQGKIEVHVKLERGDASLYRGAWESLQQSLSQRGVTLSGLDVTPPPTLNIRSAAHEGRAETLSTVAGTGAAEARLVAASAAPFSFQQDQRDSSQQRQPASSDESRSRFFDDATFAQADQRQQDDREAASAQRETIPSPFRRPANAAGGNASASGPTPSSSSANRSNAPWESWA